MMRSYLSIVLLFSLLSSAVFSPGCETTRNTSTEDAADVDDSDNAGGNTKNVKTKDGGGAEKPSAPVKNAPSPQTSVTFVTTTLANEETFAGQVYQPKIEDVLRDLEQAYRERNDDGGAMISYLVFRRISGISRDFQSILERRGSTASSRDPWILIECAYSALLRNDYGMAQFLLDSAETVGKGKNRVAPAILHARGLMFHLQKKTVQAMAAFRESARQSYEPSILTLSMFALKAGDHAGAIAQLNKIKDSAGNDLNVKAALGIAYRQSGKAEEALGFLNAVLRARPNDKRALWNVAVALAEIPGKRKDAIGTLERYVSAPGSLVDFDYKARDLLSALQVKEEAARAEANKAKAGAGNAKGGQEGSAE